MTNSDLIEYLTNNIETLSENENIEFKLAIGKDSKGELPKDFWKSYSAMANTQGGWIILGVKESKDKFSLIGLSDIEKVKKELFNLLNNRDHISINLLTSENDVQKLEISDKKILAIHIPAAKRKQKPVYLTKNPFGNTYYRLHEGDRLCDDEMVKKMLAEQVNDTFDNEILSEHYSFEEDIDLDSLKAYRNRLSSHKPLHPYLDLDLFPFFQKIGGWRKDRTTGKEGITVAGLLMFGHFSSITAHFSHYFLDYREPSNNRWEERIVPDGTWSGNLYDFYRKVYQRLVSDLKIPFVLKQDQRIDDTPAHEAIREALVNTLVHADYSARTPILIEKYTDHLLFRNPGNLRLAKDEIMEGGIHDCRNALLHQMFLLIGFGEKAGSGMPKILKGCQFANWNFPVLNEKIEVPQFVSLEIGFNQVGTKSGPSWDQVGTKSGNSIHIDLDLSDEQKLLLDNLKDSLSIKEMLAIVNRSNRTKFRTEVLLPLIESGLIEMTIPNKPTSSKQRYRLIKNL
ncbi:putative DNA binding domain-containing protein [Actinobacillus equuli subsp. equuli]|uniref:DNA binding domain-containing protein n=1 Tax=Actinobacillus equuli subsp. equuli TaxID=202947 RepID=A0A9X4G438_ACTEU|nr:RNA-binding domain-containing protein [Actinobacillus equuli]MDE8035559.1 putative DNA binding domain-containing protein [Actinobacillus equuli subsp. equuli]MDG4947320.1 putative DNA binding domain-containing protein [Actinobacillus equuli subsp. haemolyticus]